MPFSLRDRVAKNEREDYDELIVVRYQRVMGDKTQPGKPW